MKTERCLLKELKVLLNAADAFSCWDWEALVKRIDDISEKNRTLIKKEHQELEKAIEHAEEVLKESTT